LKEAIVPPLEILKAITNSLTQNLELTLLGYDLITQVETGYHAIIDVNYFPTYSGFPQFNKTLLDFLLQRVNGNVQKGSFEIGQKL